MKRAIRFLFLAIALGPAAARPGHGASPPSFLLILTDDQGRGDYSAFGTRDLETPAMDRLFREGMTFENFYANSCVCSPTRAALLTGCYPDRVGVPGVIRSHAANSWGVLSPQAILLPRLLGRAGYRTALVGKWHLGLTAPNRPNDRGFDFFHGFLGDMMDDYWTHRRHGTNYLRRNETVIDPPGHATDLFTDWACDWISAQAGSDHPFFLYLAYNAPHDPVQPPPDWLDRVQQRNPTLDPKRARLVALIEHLDAGIGRVLETLQKTGAANHTVVVFSSDNGGLLPAGANNGPWRSGKQHVYEGGLRVPCAVRWPEVIPAGSRTEQIALTMDFFPTLLDLAGVAAPTGIDGVSLVPVLRGAAPPPTQRECYFVRREGGPAYGGKTIEALRRGDWKLVQDSPFAPRELFNVRTDPRETTDLAGREQRLANELSARLRFHIQQGGAVPWQ